ncbi:family 1 glycosyl transferase [Paenibacillus sp. 32O-W]|uniref:glycosyltransferase family 4 protein n=1 Tax=Paenibacillus sp. 32O-W TaxID=1695218 RepID=UPI000720BB66|nr:glycosyltransferase family 4 protein [Paenibacillus sp. 32O-W]ALS29712.1 family 1 glycosyl transferase [Paenibacillus sp. 32O-W]
MKVILSSNIHHYNYTAKSLDRMGLLDKYITGSQFPRPRKFFRFFPGSYRKYLEHQVDSGLNPNKVESMWMLELAYKMALRMFGRNKEFIVNLHNAIFDYKASRKLDRCDCFHFVSSIGYRSAKKSKRGGAKIIVDDRAQHPVYLETILEEEFRLLDLKGDYRVPRRDALLKEYEIGDYFIVPSGFSKRTFVQYGIDEKRVYVVPYGFNRGSFYPMPKKDDVFRVIFVGQITPRKGFVYLLDAFKRLPVHNTELVMIGKVDPLVKHLMENLPSNVVHYEYVPNYELVEYYANSSVFVLPSISDAFSLVVLEAMGTGLPVIVSENVGAADVVEEGKDGFVVPIRNAAAIRDKLQLLYDDRSLRERMSRNSLAKAKAYTWDRYMNELQQVYRHIQEQIR